MSKISLLGGFQLVPEGKHVFRITRVTYDEQFGRMNIRMVTKEGVTHEERFSLLDKNSEPNEKAMNAFSYFAKTATQNYANREIDTDELPGCYIAAVARHTVQPNRNNPEKTVTFVNLGDYEEASSFEGEEAPSVSTAEVAPTPASSTASDLLASLGL